MPDDAISALLPLLVGGGGTKTTTFSGGMGNPDVIGALQAMQTPYAQGVPSNAGPIGQIAQALMPLVAGPAYAQQARQTQAEHQRDTLVKVLTLAKSMEGVDLKREEVRQAAKAAGVNEKFYDLWMKAHNEINSDAIKNAKMKVGPKGVSFEMGGGSQGKTLEERAAAGEPLAVAGLKLRQDDLQAGADRVTARSQLLASDAEQRRLDQEARRHEEDYRKKIQSGQAAAIDPVTFRKVPTAGLEDESTGRVKTLPKNDALIATQIEEGMRQLYELKSKAAKVLPKDAPNSLMGLFTTPVRAAEVKAKIARRDPDAVAFDRLRTLSKYPVIQIINKNPMRFPLAEMKDIQERGGIQDSDTQQSAGVLIDQALNNLRYTAQVLGLDPTELENSIAAEHSGKGPGAEPSKAPDTARTPSAQATPSAKEVAGQIKQMKTLGYDQERINKTLQGLYGGDVDVR